MQNNSEKVKKTSKKAAKRAIRAKIPKNSPKEIIKKSPLDYSSIASQTDAIMNQQMLDTGLIPHVGPPNPLGLPLPDNKGKLPLQSQFRVAGISFTEYAEKKMLGGDGKHDPWIAKSFHVNLDKHYRPYMQTEPINVVPDKGGSGILKIKNYTASLKTRWGLMGDEIQYTIFKGAIKPTGSTEKKIIWPKYYQNPYQYQDYIYLQDIFANTIAGRIIEAETYFMLGRGVHPKIRVKNESEFKTDEEKRDFIKEHQWMVDVLKQIDKNVSTSSAPRAFGDEKADDGNIPNIGPMGTAKDENTASYDTPLQQKWKSACELALTFGRECIIPRVDEKDNKVKVMEDGNEVEYKNIPKIIIPVHPRDMGFNYVDYLTHRLLGLQLNNSNWILKPDEMIFWENYPDNPVYGSKYYGMSEMQSMMGAARTVRQIIEVDLPLIAKSRWSGMYWLVFKRKFEDVGTSDNELSTLLANVALDGINATLEDDPDADFKLHKIDLDPKIGDLLQTVKDMIQYMQGQVGLPQGILYGEQDLNRDTLSKKISTWDKTKIKDKRMWFLDPITHAWYGRLAKTLEKQSEKWAEALKRIEVYADVEEHRLEDIMNQLQTLMLIENVTGPWTDKAKADFLDMEDLPDKIDPDKTMADVPPMPGGQGGGMTVTENGSNRSFGVQGTK